jgi:hypothetical protein
MWCSLNHEGQRTEAKEIADRSGCLRRVLAEESSIQGKATRHVWCREGDECREEARSSKVAIWVTNCGTKGLEMVESRRKKLKRAGNTETSSALEDEAAGFCMKVGNVQHRTSATSARQRPPASATATTWHLRGFEFPSPDTT